METDPELLNINIKTLDSKVFQIQGVSKNLKVSEFKARIASELDVPSDQQRLIFQGKVLKDEKELQFYSLKDGCTIHLIKKQNQRHYNASQQQRQQQQQNRTPNNGEQRTNQQGTTNFAAPNIVVGTISIPEGGNPANIDINQVLGNVFNSLGVQNPGTGFDQNYFQQQQQRFGHLESNISQVRHPTVANENWTPPQQDSNTTNNINNTETLGLYLQRAQSDYSIIAPGISHLASLLTQESTLQNVEQRQEAERLAHQLGPALQYLGALMIAFSATLSSLQMGTTPNAAQADFTPRPIFTRGIQTATISTGPRNENQSTTQPQMSVPLFTVSQRQATQNQQQQQSTQQQNQQQPTSTPQQRQTQQNQQQTQQNQQQTQQNQQQSTSTPQQRQTQQNQQSQSQQSPPFSGNVPPNINNILSMVGNMINQQLNPQNQGSSSSANQQVPDIGSLFSQMMGNTPNTSSTSTPTNTSTTPANTRTSPTTPQPQSRSQTSQNQGSQQRSNAAVLMSQTFNAVNEAISGSNPSTMSSVIGSIAHGINESSAENEKEETLLGDILQRVLDSLTIPDMLAIMSGNWEPLQRTHPDLKNYLKELCKGDVSPASLEKVSDDIVDSIKESLHESNLPADIKKRIKPGYEITSLSLHVIRKHTQKLLQVVNSDLPPTPTNSHPFALAIKEWTANFVEELVRLLSQALHGGVSDAAFVIKFFLQERLSFMGPEFSQMGTNMVTSYIMETYSSSQNSANEQDPKNWTPTIELDEIRQAHTPPQRPFSDLYLSGTSSKRRKTGKISSMDQILHDRIREACRNAKVSENKIDGILQKSMEKGLDSKYKDELIRDFRARLNADSDYLSNPSKYPNLSSLREK